jgi:hypothetical protein
VKARLSKPLVLSQALDQPPMGRPNNPDTAEKKDNRNHHNQKNNTFHTLLL